MIEHCGDRQRKFDGLQKWLFHLFIDSLPLMLPVALFLEPPDVEMGNRVHCQPPRTSSHRAVQAHGWGGPLNRDSCNGNDSCPTIRGREAVIVLSGQRHEGGGVGGCQGRGGRCICQPRWPETMVVGGWANALSEKMCCLIARAVDSKNSLSFQLNNYSVTSVPVILGQ